MNFIKSALRKILNKIQSIEVIICAIGLVTTTLLVFSQVINRYWLHFEIMWLGDLALYTFIFFMFVAAAITTWREGHVAVDFFRDRVTRKKPTAAAIYRVSLVFLSIAVLGVFLPVAYQFMLRAMKYPQYGTLVRWFNTSWLQITVFVAMAFVLLHLLVIARRDIAELIRNFLLRSGRR
ncbi:MAG TPA: TRAP transporter small permease subunit [Dehalococcoidales bacterium]|nr:TRAP transporter small permease subunit [Dehalococcoidales bacterium]